MGAGQGPAPGPSKRSRIFRLSPVILQIEKFSRPLCFCQIDMILVFRYNASNAMKTAGMLMDSSVEFIDDEINPFPEHRIRCGAHVIQLAVKDFMDDHAKLIENANGAGRSCRNFIAKYSCN